MSIDLRSDRPLFFPVTPFDESGAVAADVLALHVEKGIEDGAPAVFVACGTGEYGSLGLDEYATAVRTAVDVAAGAVPVIAGAGYGEALFQTYAARAREAGVSALLAFPPYVTASDPEGIVAHFARVASHAELPTIVYARDHLRVTPETARSLSRIPGIVGLKDASGDVEAMVRVKAEVDRDWLYFNGAPTAELVATSYRAIGIPRYSSAAFSFVPEVAGRFAQALVSGDLEASDVLIREFFAPLARIRDRRSGYAVSLVKAGLRHRGVRAGGVRAPLMDPTARDAQELGDLIDRGLDLVQRL